MNEDGGIYMSKQGQLTYRTVSDFLEAKLTRSEAAEILGVRERTVTRIARRIEAKGFLATVHGNRGKSPSRAVFAKLLENKKYSPSKIKGKSLHGPGING